MDQAALRSLRVCRRRQRTRHSCCGPAPRAISRCAVARPSPRSNRDHGSNHRVRLPERFVVHAVQTHVPGEARCARRVLFGLDGSKCHRHQRGLRAKRPPRRLSRVRALSCPEHIRTIAAVGERRVCRVLRNVSGSQRREERADRPAERGSHRPAQDRRVHAAQGAARHRLLLA